VSWREAAHIAMNHLERSRTFAAEPTDRRLDVRLEVAGGLRARVVDDSDRPVAVREVSLGGFSIQAPMAFALGSTHEFEFDVDAHEPLRLRARVAHCRRVKGAADVATYIAGFAFVADSESVRAAIETLFDCVTAAISFVDF